jgi:UDP-4-amino-4,6-dideoxy-N-acetyl-beta-L-altrosamine transaminase
MINYSRQYIDKKDIDAVVKTLKSDFLTTGPLVPKFEKKISIKVQSKFAVAVNSATSALHISCLALGLKKGDFIWTSPNSFVASANCGLYCGAKVDFIDIALTDHNIDIKQLKKKLIKAKKEKKLPKIIIPVHYAGQSCDMKEIKKLSRKYKFKIIEDASHALGGKYLNNPVGNCKYSDITVFSFHPVKIITTFEGGVATTNNKEIYKKLLMLRSHGINREFKKNKVEKLRSFYKQELLGFNYRMNDVQASIGISQLKKINFFLKKREEIKKIYDNEFKNTNLGLQIKNKDCRSTNHLYVIAVPKIENLNRDKLLEALKRKKIGAVIHYIPIHYHPYYKKLGFKKGEFPNSEKYYSEAVSLPIHPGLKINQTQFIAKFIKKFITQL